MKTEPQVRGRKKSEVRLTGRAIYTILLSIAKGRKRLPLGYKNRISHISGIK